MQIDTIQTNDKKALRVVAAHRQQDAKSTKKSSKSKTASKKSPSLTGWDTELKKAFESMSDQESFEANKGDKYYFRATDGQPILAIGLGEKSKFTEEDLRRTIANLYKETQSFKFKKVIIDMATFNLFNPIKVAQITSEALLLTSYKFDKYLTKSQASAKQKSQFHFLNVDKKNAAKIKQAIEKTQIICSGVNLTRDLINEAPNVLHSEYYAKLIEKDAKDHLKNVKIKILGRNELKKEKMGLFLSVNAASAYEPRLVHLTYTPKKSTKNTKHIALVGKGLTFDTGGLSLKPSANMMNMKFDMGGSATVYAAFRNAVQLNSPYKISCFLGITDNAIGPKATYPDSIFKSRKGLTVEVLNTDAEGRLVLADCLDYASSHKPDIIIDSATLTGACVYSLGPECGGLLGNDKGLINKLLDCAESQAESVWNLPITDIHRDDMKSNIADLRNIGNKPAAGTQKAAAFLENFIGENIKWAHFDIAGIGDGQGHLPYCPSKGGSGLIVRTITDFLLNGKI